LDEEVKTGNRGRKRLHPKTLSPLRQELRTRSAKTRPNRSITTHAGWLHRQARAEFDKDELEAHEYSRDYSIDLIKIFACFLGLVLHFNTGLNLFLASNPYHLMDSSTIRWSASLVQAFAIVVVNLFAMGSGYLMGHRRVHYSDILPMYRIVLFYIIVFVLPLTLGGLISWQGMLQFIAFNGSYWYFGAYCLMFLILPLVNLGIAQVNNKHLTFIICIAALFSASIGLFGSLANSVGSSVGGGTGSLTSAAYDFFNQGYSPMWLLIVYLFGALIHRLKDFKISTWGLWVVLIVSLAASTVLTFVDGSSALLIYNSPFVILQSLTIFLLIRRIPLIRVSTRVKARIAWVSEHAFAIYIIQLIISPVLFPLFRSIFSMYPHAWILPMLVAAFSIVCFVVFLFVDFLRTQFIDKYFAIPVHFVVEWCVRIFQKILNAFV
jgi:hypothetical protein